ncbi:hypothetical protein WA026_008705 [Henosepilachna vigintioctopunctata]|uniref:Uncharacterized protein n=1 Tax=Henosepilachna vigintioctopunctata TaxID=420089 RepID=A0AAW1V2J4_9CUCU
MEKNQIIKNCPKFFNDEMSHTPVSEKKCASNSVCKTSEGCEHRNECENVSKRVCVVKEKVLSRIDVMSQALALTRNCKSPPFSSTPATTTDRNSRESAERGTTPPTSIATPLNVTVSPSSVKEEFDPSRNASDVQSRKFSGVFQHEFSRKSFLMTEVKKFSKIQHSLNEMKSDNPVEYASQWKSWEKSVSPQSGLGTSTNNRRTLNVRFDKN